MGFYLTAEKKQMLSQSMMLAVREKLKTIGLEASHQYENVNYGKKILSAIDKYLDFKAAFSKVPYGIQDKLYQWTNNFLHSRKQSWYHFN